MLIRARPLGCFVTVVILLVILLRLIAGGYISIEGYNSDWWLKPNVYSIGDPLELVVNTVESEITDIPFGYYDLPFTCPPTPEKKPLHLSLNEIIKGDRKWESDYKLVVGQDNPCEILCARKTTREGLQTAKDLIKSGYMVQWMIDDDLPAATTYISTTDNLKYYAPGFPLGSVDPRSSRVFFNNHVMLVIRYNLVDSDKVTIVGFEAYPKSVSDYHCPGASKDFKPFEITDPPLEEIVYIPVTYSVYWREDAEIDWSDRWSLYINRAQLADSSSSTFHWMALANSVGIVLFVTFIVIVNLIMIFRNPNEQLESKENEDSSDIFNVANNWLRARQGFQLNRLIVCVSMGIQVMFMILGPLAISLSLTRLHNIKNSVLTIAALCFVAGAFMASFVGTWLKMDQNISAYTFYNPVFAVLCGSALPGSIMVLTLSLNCIIWIWDSTKALPFGTMVVFVSWYFVVCIVVSLLGGAVAAQMHRSVRHDAPPATTASDRKVLRRSRAISGKLVVFLAGLISGFLPFVIIYVELEYLYKSVWLEKTTLYYLYSFLFANVLLLCIVVCEISLLGCLVLMKLNHKFINDQNWRWRCFVISTGCSWYMEIYSLYYIFFIIHMTGDSAVFISVCYSFIFNVLCGLATGSLGYLTSSWFVKKIHRTRYTRN
ncbi:hypothetical protein ZYGR_0E01710 [Zygosaccharomyces rouxii]|uniref:Transmembrane 9 superfamily member n=2 Tax=Zygosaccharomyces rouxii TaxID=4956 RepID=C5DQX6_ZYGRC|nr:uncharacterized protein ZYRO0B03784g [Zygosaccharomyces rouxii]KAH9200264.1 hypothetical protein LQ764DRAFT_114177 [Zygosaccharomyces rouxii]GAV47155.1 hypothetical protein ZYGR_0E01710 [Zygosaccharomyces rouxii]CAR26187.1 ZYRO0B03784p [Zygosaccharomyces rouxii]